MNLIKPPSILDELISQDSENYTQQSRNRSNSSKRPRKQNTIKFGHNPSSQIPPSRENDCDSIHSNASGKSKGKKTKENSLTRPKIMHSPKADRQDDTHSVNSNASKHSHKSSKKENTIMQKPKIEGGVRKKTEDYPQNVTANQKPKNFKDAWKNEDESIINTYQLSSKKQKSDTKEKFTRENKNDQKQKINNKISPFARIQQQHESDDEPIIRLEEPKQTKTKNQNVLGAKIDYNKNTQIRKTEESRVSIEESNIIFGESKLRATKSRRRNIFDKSLNENGSRISNSIAESNVSGLEDTTRRRSNSRRQIFNNSRQKREKEDSIDNKGNSPNMITVEAPLESRDISVSRSNFTPASHQNDRLVQIQRKVTDCQEDDFSLEQSKSDLNLSSSNHAGKGQYRDRDSLIFEFQRQKKKGMSVTSKQVKNIGKSSQMIEIKNQNLVSMSRNKGEDTMLKVENNLISKQLEDVHKILKANDEYLKKNQFTKSQNKQKYEEEQPEVFNLDSDEQNDPERPWHQIVNNHQNKKVPIKTVQRNEISLRDKEQKERQKRIADEKAKWMREEKQREDIERESQNEKQRKLKEQKRRLQKEQLQREKIERQKKIKEREKERERERERQRQIKEKKKIQQQQERIQREKLEAKRLALEKKAKQEQRLRREEEQARLKIEQIQRIERNRRKQEKKKQQKKLNEEKPRLNNLISAYSREDSQAKSQQSNRSKSSKKGNKKKETTLTRNKNHKVYVRNQSPRAEESFYEEQINEKQQVDSKLNTINNFEMPKEEKKPKLISFSDEETEVKPKSKTDMNFYENSQSQKSCKPPSSKPPLSKRSHGSVGSLSKEKKPKQKTIAINIKDQNLKNQRDSGKKGQKKMTLMERALQKHNESNDSYSQGSHRGDFSSDGSRRSNSSKQSRGSKKESTLAISLKTNQMIHSKYGKEKMQRKYSKDSSQQMNEYQRQQYFEGSRQESRQKSRQKVHRMKSDIINERMIVSKNCTMIDEKGRLVQKDLVIKGKEVYGIPVYQNPDKIVLDRMRRSRQDKRKRSTSRDKNKLSRKLSRDGSESQSYEGSSYNSSSFYDNSSHSRSNQLRNGSYYTGLNYPSSNPLKEFIKPVEEVPNYNKTSQNYLPQKQTKTLNDMFTRKTPANNASGMGESRSRRSMKRTEKSRSRKG